ncbi:uncharacterized protein [Parasteatoda tepidariorum]|uniref:uncharacterized protein n=1 Tax=Parasteatoda tepidariorum TaxID=114398 RepID=UPI0039BC7003
MNTELLEKVAFDHFEKTLKITENGRYEISFPWMQSPDELPSNRELAEKRLLSTSWRLSEAGKIKDYNAVFREWLQCGIIEDCSEGPGHYLPHHAVFKPTSTTTPVRSVSDASPFLLGAVLRHHLDSFAFSPYQDVSETFKSAYYVDNCVTSVNSENELQRFVKVSTEIMAKGKFELRGWEYSAVKRSSVPMVPSQVLCFLWDKNEDVIFCDTQSISNHPENITRRSIPSMAQQVFDPLGFSCPATLYPKLLLQESWRSELGWDTEVCEDTKLKVRNWIREMRKLKDLKIRRQVFPDNYLESELHTFCNSSGLSYAAVVYLRCKTDENISVQLLMAKSRGAPLKKISIPRLELLACCMGTRLADLWIQREESWGVFVRNRVKEILKASTEESWRHIPGDSNPADLPSWGCSVEKLIKSRWWEEPHWFRTSVGCWPSTELRTNEEEVRLEIHNCSTLQIKNLHCFREKFWVLCGRRSVRHVINKCIKCRRHTVKPVETAPISLPEDRAKDASVFEIVGVDLAGPLILKGGQKSWLVLFTCAVFRAVHLELVSSLSTKDFLLCSRRFIARRGRQSVVYSDNGTNFVGAENLFRSIDWSVVESETTVKRIVWKFIPPSAGWWGGFWERMVQMVKKLLRRVLGNASPNYEELMSLLCECETVINSRPLSYIFEDRDDLIPLAPAMFLQEIRSVGVPDIDQIDLKKR